MYYFKSIMQWVLTVVLGSFIVGFIESNYYNEFVITGNQLVESTLGICGWSIIISGILSLPTVIALMYMRYYNKTNDSDYAHSRNRVLVAHSLFSILTFAIIYVLDGLGDGIIHHFIIICSIVYPITGHIIWYIGERTETQRIEPSLIR
jgi:hypothetical protein